MDKSIFFGGVVQSEPRTIILSQNNTRTRFPTIPIPALIQHNPWEQLVENPGDRDFQSGLGGGVA